MNKEKDKYQSRLRVVFLSNWQPYNPYQQLLAKSLVQQGCELEIHYCDLIFLPFFLKFWQKTILHIHTIHPFIISKHKFYQPLKTLLFLLQILILKILNIKVVWTVHEWQDKLLEGKYFLNQNQISIINNFIDAIITHSHYSYQEISPYFHNLARKNKLFTINHGNYIDFYSNQISSEEARKSLNIPSEKLVFLLFGSIYSYKGFVEAIEVFKLLPSQKIFLLIAGKPVERDIVNQIKSHSKNISNILFVPQLIEDDQVQIYFNVADCVILPYQVFTTSGVALLAMSFAKACIAPKLGHFAEILNNSGAFLYNFNESNGLLKSMKLACQNQDKILAMGEYNFQVAKEWNWNLIAQQTVNIYLSLWQND
ncbi:glycosyltransferase family 4 protein [Geminocystis sp. GBBB08]|uniref:glycosyltransferase family 4 protein n=1 Tax=Geminocystis sp. GBBB08 TaxID=2604140 RepID=UPI0027E35DD8|nr:glycosyltransferase family 4 protein [Geminocystis sp. GBBB08]MBL1209299.1 glycosyltransferase family 4 protein [Geminocystis sp. GBBB08]